MTDYFIVVAYITLPLAELMVSPSVSDLKLSLKDGKVRRAICLSISTAIVSHGFACTVHLKVNDLIISALVTRKVLADRQIREGETVSVFLDSGAIHSFA
jgi:hypothetical protein